MLADLTNQLSSMHIFIHALNSRELKDNNAIIYATITVNGLEHLKSVISGLSNISGIISIDDHKNTRTGANQHESSLTKSTGRRRFLLMAILFLIFQKALILLGIEAQDGGVNRLES